METWINNYWESDIKQSLCDYIEIPSISQQFEANWGPEIERATGHFVKWINSQELRNAKCEVIRIGERAPVILVEINAHGIPDEAAPRVLFYGHLDKQPADPTNWDAGLHPFKPVIQDGKLYGRGGADDGYALYSAVASVKYLQQHDQPHPHVFILIEAAEESGSPDLLLYMEKLMPKISRLDLIVTLDSECADYESMWITASLRGCVVANLDVSVLTEGVHSGMAGGIVPSTFRIARSILSRIEDEVTGEIKLKELHVEIPDQVRTMAKDAAHRMGRSVFNDLPFLQDVNPQNDDLVEGILNRSWRPCLEVVGADGMPPIRAAGNVLRPKTSLKLSMRIPPGIKGDDAKNLIKKLVEENPPYGAKISIDFPFPPSTGWFFSNTSAAVQQSLSEASQRFFGKPLGFMLQGVSIPFVSMFSSKFPDAQCIIAGVLGPKSNAHGPNEFLHIGMFIKLTCCLTQLLEDFGKMKK